jgi:hypothetical protein
VRINVGDVIEYIARVPVHGNLTDQVQTRRGRVIQITDRFITIQGDRYPETILVNDIHSGKVKFLKLITSVSEEGSNLQRNTRYSDRPWEEIIDKANQLMKTENLTVYKAAKKLAPKYRVSIGTMYYRLKEAGLGSDIDQEDNTMNTGIDTEGGDIVDNKTNDQVNAGVHMDPSTTLDELKKKWIQDVLETALPTADQMTIIKRLVSLEGVA